MPKKPSYNAKLKVLGRIYESTGKTVQEAIEALEVGGGAKGMSVLTITKDKVSREKVLTIAITARLFAPASKLTRQAAMKQTLMIFDI